MLTRPRFWCQHQRGFIIPFYEHFLQKQFRNSVNYVIIFSNITFQTGVLSCTKSLVDECSNIPKSGIKYMCRLSTHIYVKHIFRSAHKRSRCYWWHVYSSYSYDLMFNLQVPTFTVTPNYSHISHLIYLTISRTAFVCCCVAFRNSKTKAFQFR